MMRWLLLLSFVLYATVSFSHPFDIDLSKVNEQSELKINTSEIKEAVREETVKHGNANNTISDDKNKNVKINPKNSTLKDDAKTSDRNSEKRQENTTVSNQKEEALQDNSTLYYNNTKHKNVENVPLKKDREANKPLLSKQAMKSSVNDSKENNAKISEKPEQVTTQKVVSNKIVHVSILNDAVDLPVIQEEAPVDIPISRPGTRISIFDTVKEPHLAIGKLGQEKSEPDHYEGSNNNSENLTLTVTKLQHKVNVTDDHETLKNEDNKCEKASNDETLVVAPISLESNNISETETKPPAKIKFSWSEFRAAMKLNDNNQSLTNKNNSEPVVRGEILDKNGISVVVSADIDHVLNTTEEQRSTKPNNSTTKDTAVDKTKPGSVLKEALGVTAIEEGEPVDIPIPRPGTKQAIYFNTVVEPNLRDSTLRAIDVVKADAAHEGIQIEDQSSDVQKVVDTISKEKIEINLNRTSPSLPVAAK